MTLDLERYFNESYPPSILGGGGGPAPAPHLPGPVEPPTNANTKAQIVAWLLDHGVTLTEAALMQLNKTELLTMVADLLDEEAAEDEPE